MLFLTIVFASGSPAARSPDSAATNSGRLSNIWVDHSHHRTVSGINFSKKSDLLVSGDENGQLVVRKTESGTVVHTFTPGNGDNGSPGFLQNTLSGLQSALYYTLAHFPYSILDPTFVPRAMLSDRPSDLEAFTFSPVTEDELLVCKPDQALVIHNLTDAERTRSHTEAIKQYRACNDVLLTSEKTNSIFTDGYRDFENRTSLPLIVQYNPMTETTIDTFPGLYGESIWSADLSADGNKLVTGEDDSIVEVIDLRSGTVESTFRAYSDTEAAGFDWIRDVYFFQSGTKLVTSMTTSNVLKFWTLEPGPRLTDTVTLPDWPRNLAISENRNLLAFSTGKKIGFVTLHDRQLRWLQTIHNDRINAIAFSSDGQYIATGSGEDWDAKGKRDYSVKLWKTPAIR
ncbi:MAG: WD40 repeat domain-containing protein [bacterium]